MAQTPYTLHRWSRADYDHAISLGIFVDRPIELISGLLFVAEPKGPHHSTALGKTADVLRARLPDGWIVRWQDAIALDDDSEPEPDVAIVAGTRDDYRDEHPSRPALVIEIAESSLRFDRQHKGSIYARAGLADYWIVNLIDHVLEIYRDPVTDPSARYGWCYSSVQIVPATGTAAPLALPHLRLAVADLLP